MGDESGDDDRDGLRCERDESRQDYNVEFFNQKNKKTLLSSPPNKWAWPKQLGFEFFRNC